MIRAQPFKFDRIDPAEEKKKARSAVLGTLVVFITIIGLIRAAPLAVDKLISNKKAFKFQLHRVLIKIQRDRLRIPPCKTFLKNQL
ncbi:UNVERIFIED_CONTAM: hypothetical protein NCL1_52439 [Trichonephila clavipes]